MKPIESAIVRIFALNRTSIVGIGFLIDGKHVMTCAHVVAKALGIARDTRIQDLPVERITLDFPLVDDNHPCTASVVLWLPPMPDETGDIAVLELEQQRPFSTTPVKLVEPSDFWGKPFGTYGYPQSIGGWASGVVRGRIAGNRLQIINKDEKSYFIQPGFSGSPVYCDEAGVQGVIGMVASGETDPNLDVGFIVPAEVLLKVRDQQNFQPLPSPELTEVHKADTRETAVSGDQGSATHMFSREFAPRVVYIGKFVEMRRQLKLKHVFVAHPFFGGDAKEMDNYRYFFKDGLESIGYEPLFASDNSGYLLETICRDILDTEAGIYDVTGYNANVLIELGMSIGLNQPAVVIAQDDNAPLIPPLQQLNPIRYASRYDLTDSIGPAVRQRIQAYRQSGMSPRFCASCGLDCIARKPRQSATEYLVIGAEPQKDKAILHHLKKAVKNFDLTWQQIEGEFNLVVCQWTEEIKRCKLVFFHSKEGTTRHSGAENAATMVRVGIAVGMGIAWRMILKQEERMPTDLEGLKYAPWTESPAAFEIALSSAARQILSESRPYDGIYDPLVPIEILAEDRVDIDERPQSNTEAESVELSNSETIIIEDVLLTSPDSIGRAPFIMLLPSKFPNDIKTALASASQLRRELKRTTEDEVDSKLLIYIRIIQAGSYRGFEGVTQDLLNEANRLAIMIFDPVLMAEFHLAAALCLAYRGELKESLERGHIAFSLGDQLHNNSFKVRATHILSITHRLMLDLDASEDYIQYALDMNYPDKYDWHLGVLLCELAGLRYEQRNYIESEKLYLQAKAIFEQLNSSHLAALAMHGLGLVWTKIERYDEARVALHGALDEYRWTGNNFRVADIQFALGCCEALAGSPKVALKLLRSADNVANRLSQSPARESLLYRIHSWQSRLRND